MNNDNFAETECTRGTEDFVEINYDSHAFGVGVPYI